MSSRNKVGFHASGVIKKAVSDLELMPPSKFESCKVADPWKELAAATNEIMSLRQQMDLHMPQQNLYPGSTDDRGDQQKRWLERVVELEGQLSHTEAQYQRELTKLQAEVRGLQQAQTHTAVELQQNHEQERGALSRELGEVKVSLRDKCQQLEELENRHRQQLETAERRERELCGAVEGYESQVTQLKKYISESEEVANSTYVWQKQTEHLRQQLKSAEAENQRLESSLQLLNIRLKSQMDIQRLQEQQLAQGPDKKKHVLVLERWREKVFELLVQLESAQISHKRDSSHAQQQLVSVQDQLERERQQNEVLRHQLKDREAQIQICQDRSKVLETELSKAEQLVIHLDNKCKEQQATALSLCDFAQSVYEQVTATEKPVREVYSRLDSLNQRISFATGRVEMLQSQFLRKEALLKMQLEEKSHTSDPLNPHTTTQLRADELGLELERVQQERDKLAAQIKQDALTLQSRIQAAQQQVSDEVQGLKTENTDLRQQLEDKDQELQAALSRTEDPGKSDERCNKQGVSAAERLVSESEQLTQMQLELSQARKEQSKALVSVRQLERQMEREREKSRAESEQIEVYYRQQVVRLEQQVNSLATDRNILMTNCQQEGLLQSKRQPPAPGTEDVIEELKYLSEEVLQDSDDISMDDNQS